MTEQVTEALQMPDAHKDIDDFTLPSERALREACYKAGCQWTAINMMRVKGMIDPALVRAIYAFARYIDATHTVAPADEDAAMLRGIADWLGELGGQLNTDKADPAARFLNRIAERLAPSKGGAK